MSDDQKLTVGELRRLLAGLSDDHLLSFSGHLTFYRLKRWNDHEHLIEFNEPQGLLSEGFKKSETPASKSPLLTQIIQIGTWKCADLDSTL